MSNKRLKIENLENLQELNAEEFSSIQGGLLAKSTYDLSATGKIPVEDLEVNETNLIYFDPCYTPPPCEVYVFYYEGKKIEFKACPMIL